MNIIIKLILDLYTKFRNLILYGIIGTISAGTDFLTYFVLTNFFEVFYLTANIFSISLGITISFILNKRYNFKVQDSVFKRFVIFISVGFGGMLLSSAILYYFIDVLHSDKIFSKFSSIVLVVLVQFFLNKFITFKKFNYEQ